MSYTVNAVFCAVQTAVSMVKAMAKSAKCMVQAWRADGYFLAGS